MLERVAFAAVDVFRKIVEPKFDVILAFAAVELSVNVVAPWELWMLALLALELLLNVVELPLMLLRLELPAVDVSLKTIAGAVVPD